MKRRAVFFSFILIFFFSINLGHGEDREIRILHVNDIHGFAEPYKPLGANEMLGGMAHLAFRSRELRIEKPSLLLSAGDMIQGHNWANFFQGESVMEMLNAMDFDAMALGNHEFDFGQAVLKKRISEAKFPLLAANVDGLDRIGLYVIREVNGIKVGIIGVVTEDVPATTDPRNVQGLHFSPPRKVIEEYVKEVREKADIVIVLSHIGHPLDRKMAEEIGGIDVIIGGHSHSKVTRPVKVKDTLVVQAWEHGKALGVLDLTLKDGKVVRFDGRLEEIKPQSGKEDPQVRAIVEKYKQKMAAVFDETLGESEVDLDGETKNIRTRETNLGNFIADALRGIAGAEVAIINGGAIRASIRKGKIRMKDIYTTLPFDNYVVAIKLTGRQIREALEHGVSAMPEEEGRFSQVSGITFTYSLLGKPGSRVKDIFFAGKPMDIEKEYVVATNDFLAVGGDGYKSFGDAIKGSKDFSVVGGAMTGEKVVYSDSGKWLRDGVADQIRKKGRISPQVEGRIREIR